MNFKETLLLVRLTNGFHINYVRFERAFLVFVVLGDEETVLTLKRLLSMHRDRIACGSGSQGWGKDPNL